MVLTGVSFADANATFEDAEFVILGIPFDRTASFRSGARFAPNAIREASYNFETYLFEHEVDLVDVNFHDAGNLEELGTVDEMVKHAGSFIEGVVSKGKFPIVLGGEHSVTIPAVRSFRDVGVVSIDAHLDFRQEYLGERNSHACVTRRIAEHVGMENVVVLGVRSMSREEVEGEMPEFIDAFTIREEGMERAVRMAMNLLGKEKIYLTLDIDGIDPACAPGTGTPEPFGISDLDVKKCIDMLSSRLVGFDLVEVCPNYDKGNTAALSARLVREVLATTWKSRHR
jgi:agmatinase